MKEIVFILLEEEFAKSMLKEIALISYRPERSSRVILPFEGKAIYKAN